MASPIQQPTAIERVVRVGVGLAVALLVWPAEEELRRQLALAGQPRVLIVEPGVDPPERLDRLEDWVRAPADPADAAMRARSLVARLPAAAAPAAPFLDEDGLLHANGRWVVIPPAQLALVALLLANVHRVVRTPALIEACVAGGASGHPASVRTLLSRLRTRVQSIGLELVTVRQRGVLLRCAGAPLDGPLVG